MGSGWLKPEMHMKPWSESLKGGNLLKHLWLGGKVILKCTLKVGWFLVAQDTAHWWADVNMVMDFLHSCYRASLQISF